MTTRLCAASLLLGVMTLSGCFKVNYLNGNFEGASAKKEWRHRAILGLVEISDPVALQSICPSGFGKAQSQISLPNGLVMYGLNVVGLGFLYNPSQVTVWCSGGTAYQFDQQDDGRYVVSADSDAPLPNLDGLVNVED